MPQHGRLVDRERADDQAAKNVRQERTLDGKCLALHGRTERIQNNGQQVPEAPSRMAGPSQCSSLVPEVSDRASSRWKRQFSHLT